MGVAVRGKRQVANSRDSQCLSLIGLCGDGAHDRRGLNLRADDEVAGNDRVAQSNAVATNLRDAAAIANSVVVGIGAVIGNGDARQDSGCVSAVQ